MMKESDAAPPPPTLRKSFPPPSQTPANANVASSRGRIYRTIAAEGSTTATWVTRDIAALDFLLGIPMEAEADIVRAGWMQQQQQPGKDDVPLLSSTGKWWEKFVKGKQPEDAWEGSKPNRGDEQAELEQPDSRSSKGALVSSSAHLSAPGRRLDGDDAILVKIPQSGMLESKTRQRSIARQAAIREWETRVALGLDFGHPPLLDGRVFFSASEGYPMGIFSLIRYEPKREEAARRRQKLEALGGGGSQFVIPERDWRGTSYRALLPRVEKENKSFNRLLHRKRQDKDDETGSDADSEMSTSSVESDEYVPGFLDDPEMVQGRHRHVMIGDRVTGCIVSSTILYVDPEELKADLNKQFRERFDGWEPPKSQWKYIGAKVIDGVYTLSDPTEDHDDWSKGSKERKGSLSSLGSSSIDPKDTLRMPPSLTLSKIRSIKREALMAAVNFKMEVSTVALACVYFERLCLDTRVDKSNRRLAFAACLLLAAKINEKNVRLDIQADGGGENEGKITRLRTIVKPSQASHSMFASLLEFFAHDWEISLKTLFAAEWGVFAALGFSLHTTPSQVAFHFKRMMKGLEWSPLQYLGPEMYSQWQKSLDDEDLRRKAHEKRKEQRRERNERKLLKLQREHLHSDENQQDSDVDTLSEKQLRHEDEHEDSVKDSPSRTSVTGKKSGPMNFLLRLKKISSADKLEKLAEPRLAETDHPRGRSRVSEKELKRSPSLPVIMRRFSNDGSGAHVAIDINEDNDASEAHVAIDINEENDADDESSTGAISDGALMF